MEDLMMTISVEGDAEKTRLLNEALLAMNDIRVVENGEETRGPGMTSAIKWVVTLLGDAKAFGEKLCDVVEKQLAGSTVKLQCPPGITIEISNASRGQLVEIMTAAMAFMKGMNAPQ